MQSNFFLTFKDKKLEEEFILSRKNSLIKFSSLILLYRCIISTILAINFSTGQTTLTRFLTYFIGTLLYMTFLALFWRFPLKLSRYYALLCMLAYLTYLYSKKGDLPIDP